MFRPYYILCTIYFKSELSYAHLLQAKLAFERLHILKVYHPFICGPENRNVKELQEQTGARISVPPPSVHKDEIAVAGEKEGVHTAIEAIMKIYEEKVNKSGLDLCGRS